MKTRIARLWDAINGSYWFLPGVMAVGAMLLVSLTQTIDHVGEPHQLVKAGWIFGGNAEGANQLLSRLAGSMITSTSVVFSITLVTLTLAARQYGTIVLRNFMHDRVTQVALGVFNATFITTMITMHSVRGGANELVPRVSITTSVVLGLLSVFVLVYFIHHMAQAIQADHIVNTVDEELRSVVDTLYPPRPPDTRLQLAQQAAERLERELGAQGAELRCDQSGYLQLLAVEDLALVAQQEGLVLKFRAAPGDFLMHGTLLAHVWPADRLDDRLRRSLLNHVVIGDRRRPTQDVEYCVHQFVEMASRALAEGYKDPMTATLCLDRLGNALAYVAERPEPLPYTLDRGDELRVITRCRPFSELLGDAFDWVRLHGAGCPSVLTKLLQMLNALAQRAHRADDRTAIREQADRVLRAAAVLPEQADREQVSKWHGRVKQALGDEGRGQQEAAD